MQNLPVFEAVVEILQSFLLETENSANLPVSIGVDIKAKRRLQKYDAVCQVFYVRVCCSHGIDLEMGFEDNEYKRFGELLLCMQTGETVGHLSVQRAGGGGGDGVESERRPGRRQCEQRVYWLEQGSEERTRLTCQHSTLTDSVDSEVSPYIIHFRVIQRENHIVSEGHRIHKYLHKMKLLKEKVDLSFSMKVCGTVCQTDFSVKRYTAVQNFSIADDIRHSFGKQSTRRLWCGGARACTGDRVHVIQCCATPCAASTLGLAVFSLVSLHPLVERYPEAQSGFGLPGHVVINFFGPGEVALGFPDDHFKSLDVSTLLNTAQFSLALTDPTTQLHGDVTLGATLTDLRYLPPWASHCTSYLLCVAVVVTGQDTHPDRARTHDITNSLQNDPGSLSCVLKSAGKSISSCLKQIFVRRETEHEKMYRSAYVQCTAMITSSVCDIFNHSLDPTFRSQMVHLLQAESKEALKTNLADKLNKIARISNSKVPSRGDKEDDVDVWHKECEDNSQQSQTDMITQTEMVPDKSLPASHWVPSTVNASALTASDNEDDLFDAIAELNNFDHSIGIQDTYLQVPGDVPVRHSLQEHSLPRPDNPLPIQRTIPVQEYFLPIQDFPLQIQGTIPGYSITQPESSLALQRTTPAQDYSPPIQGTHREHSQAQPDYSFPIQRTTPVEEYSLPIQGSIREHSPARPEALTASPGVLEHFTEQDLTFFPNDFENFDEDIPIGNDGVLSTDEQGLASSVQTPEPPQRQPIVHSPTGDEWLDNVMFDMSDWL